MSRSLSLAIIALAALALPSCHTVKQSTAVRSLKTVKVMPDDSHELTWVLVREQKTKYDVATDYRKGFLGTEIDNIKTIPVEESDKTTLWLCYRRPDRSRPYCYKASWRTQDEGPRDLIRDRFPRRSQPVFPKPDDDDIVIPDKYQERD